MRRDCGLVASCTSTALLCVLACVVMGCGQHQARPGFLIGHAPDALQPGRVEPTRNPQVARYTIVPQSAAQVAVAFGTTTDYGKQTSIVTDPGGQPANIFVAGMRADTTYHMRASVRFQDGTTLERCRPHLHHGTLSGGLDSADHGANHRNSAAGSRAAESYDRPICAGDGDGPEWKRFVVVRLSRPRIGVVGAISSLCALDIFDAYRMARLGGQ